MNAFEPTTFLSAVSLRNYKSILSCNVAIEPLTIIVGRNGSGKSNFLDSLHFVSDALQTSLEHAVRKRGGSKEIVHRSKRGAKTEGLLINLEFTLDPAHRGSYTLELGAIGLRVRRESLTISNGDSIVAAYRRDLKRAKGESQGRALLMPRVLPDRLHLVAVSGMPEFRSAFDALSAMGFYNLNPEAMKELHSPDAGNVLAADGSNAASVLGRIQLNNRQSMKRLSQYLGAIVPGVERVHRYELGPKETIHFHQKTPNGRAQVFLASSMSDGTLRALGALLAVRQVPHEGVASMRLVGIEEPETALHPAAIAALVDALREATSQTQVIATTHSPDVLDQVRPDTDGLLVAELEEGATRLAPVDRASSEAIRRHLYTAGELLRMNQLQPATPS